MPSFARIIFVFLFLFQSANCAELIVVKSQDSTSKDIPLKFTFEKSTWDGHNIEIWGTVKNPETDVYESVQVILTARDEKGGFIGRDSWLVEPSRIEAGQSAYLMRHVRCEKRKPAVIEFSVTGDKK